MAVRHILTCEYPPQPGGVSDYTYLVASGLAAAGDEVHVWCPAAESPVPQAGGVTVHPELGTFAPADLRRVGGKLNRFPPTRRLLLQWVPHGYGYKSINVWICLWIWYRAVVRGDDVEIMVHEPYLAFRGGSWRQVAAAAVHRLMTMILLQATRRVWVATPASEAAWRPYALGRRVAFAWVPVPSNITPDHRSAEVALVRERLVPEGALLVGHFGTYNRHMAEPLGRIVPALLRGCAEAHVLLMGRGSEGMREALVRKEPQWAGRIHATGALAAVEASVYLRGCDILLQPYPEGVSTRRGSVMAGLSHGLPVVTTAGPLTEPIWAESGAVVLVPAEDVRAMVDSTVQLLRDEDGRRRASAGADELYRERFDIRHTVAALRRSGSGDE